MKFINNKTLLSILIFGFFIPFLAFAEFNDSDWTNINPVAGWGERTGHSMVSFKDRVWFFGGLGRLKNYNDVWVSDDFKVWEEVGKFTNINGNRDFTSLVYDDKVWIIGGKTHTDEYLDEVWYSEDMINWLEIDSTLPWDERAKHSSVIFNNKMWIIGGKSQNESLDEVWHSSNGVDWFKIEEKSPWSERYGHASLVFDDKIWIFGGLSNGEYLNDIWTSDDGVSWIQIVENSDWADRYLHDAIIFDDSIWIFGGLNSNNSLDDAWRSKDGVNWEEVDNYPVGRRYLTSSIVHDDKLVLSGGYSDGDLDDLWLYDLSEPELPAAPVLELVPNDISEIEDASEIPELEKFEQEVGDDILENSLNTYFSDLTEGTNYTTAINYLAENGVVDGYSDGTFRPNAKINRAEFLKIVLGARGYVGGDLNCFSDVSEEWFAPYICTAKELDIINGYPDGTFKPANLINVVEALKITLVAFDANLPENSEEWYLPFTQYALTNNLMLSSFSDYSYEITRGEMSELIHRMLN